MSMPSARNHSPIPAIVDPVKETEESCSMTVDGKGLPLLILAKMLLCHHDEGEGVGEGGADGVRGAKGLI